MVTDNEALWSTCSRHLDIGLHHTWTHVLSDGNTIAVGAEGFFGLALHAKS